MNKETWKSIWAVAAGFLTVVLLSSVTDVIVQGLGLFSTSMGTWLLLFALVYRSAYTVLGGYVTARLAPGSPMKHVRILGIIGIVGGVLGIIVGWSLGEHWYPIAIMLTAFPLTWWGGKLRVK